MHFDLAPSLPAFEQVKPTWRLALKAHPMRQIYLLSKLCQERLLRLSELPSHQHAEIFTIASVDADVPS